MPEYQQTQQSKNPESSSQRRTITASQNQILTPVAIIQRARINPKSLTSADILQLQRTIGNRAVGRLLSDIRSPSTTQQKPIQCQEMPEEEEPLQGKFESKSEQLTCLSCSRVPIVQRQEIPEEEEPLQEKMIGTVQRQEIPEEEEPLQTKRENNTGMPDNLKAGVESLSGIDMSDVRVHYNSSKPFEVGALAYTQGTNIHVAPGQEKHLPHEAWHVVQQKRGRVQATKHLKNGIPVNDDNGLEYEADVMGARTAGFNFKNHVTALKVKEPFGGDRSSSIQMFVIQLFRMTGNAEVPLLDKPSDLSRSVVLPANTRIKIHSADLLGLHGDKSGPNQWIQIEVTTGLFLGKKGWVQSKDLDAADQAETAQVTMSEAKRLFDELKGAKFTSSTGEEADIPFSYPIDGCYARAHRMMELLTEKGYASEKAFAVAKSTNSLRVPSSKASDTAIGTPPVIQWGYHVAPIITLDKGEKYVIDPSMFDQPVLLTIWVGSMGPIANFKERSIDDIKKEYTVIAQSYRPGEDRYYITPREQYYPVEFGGHLPANSGNVKYYETGPSALGRDMLMSYAKDLEPIHILASQIRGVLAGAGTQDEKYKALQPIFSGARVGVANNLAKSFPILIKEMDQAIGLPNSTSIRLFYWR